MTRFVVNIALLVCIIVLAVVYLISAARRRRRELEQRTEDRRLVLDTLAAALTKADPQMTGTADLAKSCQADEAGSATQAALSGEAISALIEMLEQHRRPRRGLVAGLMASPHSAWLAGTDAGGRVARRLNAQDQQRAVVADDPD